MRKLLYIFIFFFVCKAGFAQALLTEEFNYTAGDLLTAHSWIQSGTSTTNPIAVTSPGLSYTNYPSVLGNAATLTNTGQDVYKAFTTVTSGSVYMAFLVNVQSAGTGDYFLGLSPSNGQTNYYARLFIKANGSGYSLGLSKSNELSSGSIYGTTVLNFNTTYIVVVKHSFVTASTTDDTESVYVFSSPNMPGTEPASAEIAAYANATKTDPTDLGFVTLRQGSGSAAAPSLILDGIRIGTVWNDVLPAPTIPVATAATNITSTGFTANWNSFVGATSYFLDVSTASDFSTFLSDYNGKEVGNVTSYDITALDPNTTYYYRVRSTDGTATTSNSNIITVGTLVPAPNALAATNITSTGFTANWETSSGSTGYWLDVATAEDFSAFVEGYNNKEVGNVTTLNVTSLNAGTKYYYRVRGSSANGASVNSNVITVETSGVALPVALNPTNITADGFTANWSFPETPISFFLDISTKEDFSTFVEGYNSKEAGTVTSLVVSGLNASTVYYYRLHASTSGGISPNSNVISVITLLGAPIAKPATNIAATSFTANWEVTSGVTTYWLDVSTSSDFSLLVNGYDNKPVGKVGSYEVTSLNPNTIYYYRVSSSNSFGTSPYSETITVTPVVGIQDASSTLPTKYDLLQNYPNPFNPSTIIKYQLPESGFVTIKVYNITGSEICTLVSETKSAGTHEVRFNASNLTSGTYIYKIQSGKFSQTKKMLLLK
jgi:phosphodiesterase/alkaline phosphatase D-like protein